MLKVAKFGGSSVASAEQFKKVKEIVKMDASRKFVVVSAVGKANKDDNKITDLLYLCYAHIKYNMNCDAVFSIIEKKFCDIAKELNLRLESILTISLTFLNCSALATELPPNFATFNIMLTPHLT